MLIFFESQSLLLYVTCADCTINFLIEEKKWTILLCTICTNCAINLIGGKNVDKIVLHMDCAINFNRNGQNCQLLYV